VGGFVLVVWSPCLWPVAVQSEELAVALPAMPDSPSANTWPTRPCQAQPRQIPGSNRLRVFRNVPSAAGVRADYVVPYPATRCAAVLVIETDSISMIGPKGSHERSFGAQ
jgi:hypothetical protein